MGSASGVGLLQYAGPANLPGPSLAGGVAAPPRLCGGEGERRGAGAASAGGISAACRPCLRAGLASCSEALPAREKEEAVESSLSLCEPLERLREGLAPRRCLAAAWDSFLGGLEDRLAAERSPALRFRPWWGCCWKGVLQRARLRGRAEGRGRGGARVQGDRGRRAGEPRAAAQAPPRAATRRQQTAHTPSRGTHLSRGSKVVLAESEGSKNGTSARSCAAGAAGPGQEGAGAGRGGGRGTSAARPAGHEAPA